MGMSHNSEELQELVNRGPSALTSQFRSTHAGGMATASAAKTRSS